MPTSNPNLILDTIRILKTIKPKSILDVGCGFGKWGFLCRELFDIAYERYNKEDWKIRIDGVEIYKPYLTPFHSFIYDNMYSENILTFKLEYKYDLVIFGDILEHLEKEQAFTLIKKYKKICKHVIITSTKGYIPQGEVLGNKHEEHKFGFTFDEMDKLGAMIIDCGIVFIAYFNSDKDEGKDINNICDK